MFRFSRRRMLASGAVAAAAVRVSGSTAAAHRPHRHYVPMSVVTTITLVNTSAAATNPGTVTQIIGCPFKKGDIVSGTWPQFQMPDGTNVPCTILNALATTWSDGSLKFVPVMLSVPESIAANGSTTVSILTGGSLPSPSPRSLSDFSNGIEPQVHVQGLDNLSGSWVMDLVEGINAQTKITAYGNGAAGAVWKVRADATQSRSIHGQLLCDFYIASLANPDGSLKGLRILGKVKLPYYNTTKKMNWMSFARFQLCLNSQGMLIRDCFGNNFGSAAAYNFTWKSGAVFDADSGYSTDNYGDYGYCTRLTTTGTLPAGLHTNTSYFTGGITADTIGFATSAVMPNGTLVKATNAGSGKHTATPYPYLAYFGALFTAGPTGMWDFVQGAGTDSSDTTLRFQMNQAYWVSTGLIPSYDLSVQPTSNNPTTYWPNCSEPVTRYLDTTGERDDLGILPAWYARHFYTQAPVDEQVVRVVSLVGGHAFSIGLESSATLTYPCANDGVNGNAYSGMPAPNPQFCWTGANRSNANGFKDTTNVLVRIAGFGMQNTTHMPQFSYYPYLFTGEPWHLDILLEHANSAVYQRWTVYGTAEINDEYYALGEPSSGGGERILQVGSNPWRYGSTVGCNLSSERADAWGSALLAAAAAICPDKNPDCVSYKQYFNDMNTTTWNTALDIFNALPAFAAQAGLWEVPDTAQVYMAASWQLAYLGAAIALAATATENADALTTLNAHVQYFDYVWSQFGGWHVASYMTVAKMGNAFGSPLVTGPSNLAFFGPNFTWSVGKSFVLTPFRNYTPADGDVVIFADTYSGTGFVTPLGFLKYTPYYMVNLSGNTFDLALTPGGLAIPLTDSYHGGDSFYIVSSNPPSTGSISAIGAPEDYNTEIVGMLNYAVAAGATVSNSALSDLTYRNQQAGLDFTSDPKWALTSTFAQGARRYYSRRFTAARQ